MRTLLYVPVIHSFADMGSQAEGLARAYVERYGEEKWAEHRAFVDALWAGIEERILRLELDLNRAKLYQDGLPICGKEEEIVREVAAKGSPNHRIVLDLVERGASLVGTEDPDLLLREHSIQKQRLAGGGEGSGGEEEGARVQALLEERDRFIAKRIDATLEEGETGILFIGLMHDVQEHLPEDMTTRFVVHRLPFGKGVARGVSGRPGRLAGGRRERSGERQ